MKKLRIFRDLFRFHSLKTAFQYAIQGIFYLFFFHRNMRIIFLLGILSLLFGVYFKLKAFEFKLLPKDHKITSAGKEFTEVYQNSSYEIVGPDNLEQFLK